MFKYKLRFAALAGLALALSTSASGQARTARYTLNYGGSQFGGSLDLRGTVYRDVVGAASYRSATGSARALIRLLGRTTEAASVNAHARLQQGRIVYSFRNGRTGVAGPRTGTAGASIRVAGKTIWTTSSSYSKSWTKKFGPYDLLPQPASYEFAIGPVPVVVQANAGVGAGVGVTASLNTKRLSATLSGWANGYAYGWASAGVGMRYASAGVQATLKFANTTPSYSLTADLNRVSGRLTVRVTPIQLLMQLYAQLFNKRWTKTVYTWSMRAITKVLYAH